MLGVLRHKVASNALSALVYRTSLYKLKLAVSTPRSKDVCKLPRNNDKIGTFVVLCRDDIPEEKDLRHVIVGSATRLKSQFRLTYIMILHLLRVEYLKQYYELDQQIVSFYLQMEKDKEAMDFGESIEESSKSCMEKC